AGSCPGLEPQKTQSLSMWTRYSNEQALMLAGTETLATIANHWLARFEHALASGDRALLESLFHSESHWRDVLALTWRIGTVSGTRAIAAALTQHAPRARPGGFRTDPERTAPRHVTRAGKRCVEAITALRPRSAAAVVSFAFSLLKRSHARGPCSPRSTSSGTMRRTSAAGARRAGLIRAISPGRTGSTSENRIRPI